MAFEHLHVDMQDEIDPNDCAHDKYPEQMKFNSGDPIYICSNCGIFIASEQEREADMGDTEWVE